MPQFSIRNTKFQALLNSKINQSSLKMITNEVLTFQANILPPINQLRDHQK